MDGTLVDTEPYWMDAETALVESYGGTWTHEAALTLVGAGLWHSARVLQSHGVELGEEQIIEALTDAVLARVNANIPWRPGARELLLELKQAGIPTALVTMSMRRLALRVSDAIDFDAFDVIVAGDDVTHSKPHPEPYLMAADLLGVNAADCVAIEDSEPGAASAVASGAATIGVPLHVGLADDQGYVIWPTLAGQGITQLSELLESRRKA